MSDLEATGCTATRSGGCCTQSQCTAVLQTEVDKAASQAASIFGNQCDCVQAVLTDLTYNLGDAGMRGFPHFIAQIQANDWAGAASNLQSAIRMPSAVILVHQSRMCLPSHLCCTWVCIFLIGIFSTGTLWCSQVGGRCPRDVAIVRNGC
jgi:hypothetical protein